MKRISLILTLLGIPALIAAWALTRSADNPAGEATLLVEQQAGAAESSPDGTRRDGPRAAADATEHHFGTMDSLKKGVHHFVIRNEGTKPLKLTPAGTTCKCTLSEISQDTVPPGGSAEVEVSWNTISEQKYYSQTATIRTNDPEHPEIILRVYGSVLNRIMIEPSELALSRIEPDQSGEAGVLIYSQVWPKFTLENFRCSLAGFQWNVSRATAPAESSLVSGDVYRISVTSPSDLPRGSFRGVLQFDLVPEGEDQERQACEIVISGTVLRRFAVYGPEIDSDGLIDLGLITRGQTVSAKLLVKIRDEQKLLDVRSIEVQPAFVECRLEPAFEGSESKGIYRLHLTVPTDAPSADFLDTPGSLRIVTDHPRIGQVDLKLRLSVVGKL